MQRVTVPAILSLLFLLTVGLAYFGMIDLYTQSVIMFIGINIILASSLNLVNGYMGEFSCGHAGFMAVGAYVSSILNVVLIVGDPRLGGPFIPAGYALYVFPLTLFAGALAAAFFGLLVAVPSFKTRGDYLAIITIAAGYIIKSTIENLDVIGGARGYMGMRKVIDAMDGVAKLPWMLIWIFLGTVFTIWMLYRYVSSTYGKAVIAINQDEIASEIMSVNTNNIKLTTFMLSSGLAGLAGGLFAHVLGYVNPGSFTILKSTEVLVMVYLGGMGSLSGSIVAAVVMTIMLEVLRPLQIIKWVAVPLLLIILMLFRPEGIFGNREIADIFPKLRKWYKFK